MEPNPVYGMGTASNEGHIPTQSNPVYGTGTAGISPVYIISISLLHLS